MTTFNDLLNQDAYDRAIQKYFLNRYRMAPETLRSALQFDNAVRPLEAEFRRGWNEANIEDVDLTKAAMLSLSRKRQRPPGACF